MAEMMGISSKPKPKGRPKLANKAPVKQKQKQQQQQQYYEEEPQEYDDEESD